MNLTLIVRWLFTASSHDSAKNHVILFRHVTIEKTILKTDDICVCVFFCLKNSFFIGRKEEIYSIKNILEDCLNSKCQNKLIPIYDPKKPPLKILAFKESQKIDNLILDHEKFKYNKLSKKIENKDLKNLEKDELISEFKKENKKLKKTVDKMLVNYQKKISKLEKDNKQLQENFNKVFNMLPKSKQKKFENN